MLFIKKSFILRFICYFLLTLIFSCTQNSDQEPLVVKDNLFSLQFSTNILDEYTKRELNTIERKVNDSDSSKREILRIWQMKAEKIKQQTATFKQIRDSCLNKKTSISKIKDCLSTEFEVYKTGILQVDPQIAKAMFNLFSKLLIEREFTKVNEIRYQNDLFALSNYFIAIIENQAISFCNSQI